MGEASTRGRAGYFAGFALALLVGAVVGGFLARDFRSETRPVTELSALDEFWAPIIASNKDALLSIGQVYASQTMLKPNGARNRFDTEFKLRADVNGRIPLVVVADSEALARVTGFLQSRNKSYVIQTESETTLSDLTTNPHVLIGAFDNDWTIRLTDQLRFRFEKDPSTREEWIIDQESPDKKIGPQIVASKSTNTAYAIVSRVRDPATGQMVIAIAGISPNGTRAASLFVSRPEYIGQFAKGAPPNWVHDNLQILIAADLVDGSLGPPRVITSYEWPSA